MSRKVQDLPVVLHNSKRGLLTVEDGRLDILQLSNDGRPPKRLLSTSSRNLLRLGLAPGTAGDRRRLDVHALIQKSGSTSLRLSKMHVLVEPINVPEAEEWVDEAMRAAYPDDLKPCRRVLLLVNPIGGKGKARSIVAETVLPILEAAGCVVDVKETKYHLHAEELARDLPLEYDVIATASGDGLVYEVLNGLAARKDARKALQTPIAPLPTGSACAVCINLFGVQDTFNMGLASLNVIKGSPIPLDLISVLLLPSQTRRFGFLSVAIGLMVDLDIGTENLRWLGDSRFMVGFLRGLAQNKNVQCRIRMKVVESDKVEMARRARDKVRLRGQGQQRVIGGGTNPLVEGMGRVQINGGGAGSSSSKAPASPKSPKADKAGEGANGDQETLEHVVTKSLEPDDSWVTISSASKAPAVKLKRTDINAKRGSVGSGPGSGEQGDKVSKGEWIDGEGILYIYAGMMPWAARDLMQWPVASEGDGVIDVVVQSVVPRLTMASAITGAEKGEAFWMQCQHYYKASAFVVENLDKTNQPIFTIDGEPFPWDSFHVEVHPRLGRLMSLDEGFFVSDFLKKHDGKA